MANFFKTLVVGAALATAATANADLATLSVEVSNVTSKDADFVITCDNADVPFYYQIVPAAKLEQFGGVSGIYEFQKAEWEGFGASYDCPWTDFIPSSMRYYEIVQDSASEWTNVIGGIDYVVFALGMDPEGNLTTNVAYKEFTAVAGTPSDNTFDVSLEGVVTMESRPDRKEATLKVTPSNGDTYVVEYYGKEFVDKYGDLTPGTLGYINLVSNMLWNVNEASLLSGEQTVKFDRLMPDKEFTAVVIGMDSNLVPTTGVKTFSFSTGDNPVIPDPTDLATLSVEVSNVTSTDADFVIACDNAEVPFYYQVVPAYKLEQFGGVSGIYDFQKAEWENLGSMYECPWTDFIGSSMTHYESAQDNASSWVSVIGGVDYVVFALGMDPAGNLTTNVAYKEFTAVAGEPSENTFDIKLLSVKPMESRPSRMEAALKVTPSNSDTYTVQYYGKDYVPQDLTPGSEGYIKLMGNIMGDVDAESLISGEKTVTFDRLTPGTDYTVVVVGLDSNLAPTTAVKTFTFTSKEYSSGDEPEEPANTIDLQLSNITSMDAHLVLTASDPEMLYYMDVSKASSVEEHGGIENIPNALIIDWWKWLADMYSMDWTEIIPMQTRKGNLDCNLSDLIADGSMSSIYWGGDYVLYAVGFDLAGNVISNTAAVSFSTPAPEKNSTLTFEFTPVSFKKNEKFEKYYDAVFNVTPSNNDEEYFTEYCKTRILDQYEDGSLDREYTEDEILISQFMEYAQYHQGPCTVEMPNLDIWDSRGDVDYYIFAVGWNDGPTTSIQKYKFNIDTEIPGSGITIEKSDDPFVTAINGHIEVQGNYEAAAVFSTSGQHIGSLRPGRSLSVEPGVYVVHYLAGGVNHTTKVLVK